MINVIHVRNFKCLYDVKVQLEPFTVLIGPNDSGKSSLLACLAKIGQLYREKPQNGIKAFAKDLTDNASHNAPDQPVEIFVNAKPPGHASYLFSAGPAGDVRQVLTLNGFPLDSHADLSGGRNNFQPPNGEHYPQYIKQINTQLCLLTQFFNQSTNSEFLKLLVSAKDQFAVSEKYQLSPARMREPSQAVREPQLKSDGSNLACVVNSLLTAGDYEVINAVMESLNRAIPSIKGIATPPFNENGAARELRYVLSGEKKPPNTIPAAEASDGVMFFTAFLAIAYSQMSNTILIEEPENGLHPERIETIVKLLRQLTTGELGYSPRQIILTTHSPLLLNYVEPKEVRIFQRDDQVGTSVTPMHEIPEIDRLQKEYATGELWYMLGEKALLKGPSK